MRLGLALITEAADRMTTGKAAGLAEEDREDIKPPIYLFLHLFLLKTHNVYS